ncbi:phytanoyl-CoA dioxygenase family protein [Roseinatronobacter sp.]|uniref:phytanoyl-CoA dioxygenase family protein n=1 Tax=Roseinatronobacter sp. TaxID=1945755 RepID=UPI003F4DECB2
MTLDMPLPHTGFYDEDSCDLAEFASHTSQNVDLDTVPHAKQVLRNVPVYDMAQLSTMLGEQTSRRILMAEWARVLHKGAGVFVLKQACPDHDAIDAATQSYEQVIAQERAAGGAAADHFAAAGSNDRIWNSLQKLALKSPATFIRYFASPAIDAACEAWLGPNYQMTAQVNLVHPGGQAQQAHRDYHLGFQSADISASYPANVHHLSPLMTLQGGIAHCDIPVASGPTKLLPFSQLYKPGYAAWRRDDFRAHFEAHYVQLPLEKGDAIFFNPALFHAAGANKSADIHRMVNLLQISSAFGRAMETVDRAAICKMVFPALREQVASGQMSGDRLEAVLGSTAEGYSFPTNLDRDPPVGGLAPQTQKAILRKAVMDGWSEQALSEALDALAARQMA